MRNKVLIILAIVGIILGIAEATFLSRQKPTPKPVFNPAPNPYTEGIYSLGIIESHLLDGENINLFPEVQGRVMEIFVREGQEVKEGDPILRLDDSIQKATLAQQMALAQSAKSALEELKAQPRKEVLEVNKSQMEVSRANLKNVKDQLKKIQHSLRLNSRSISKDVLDNAKNQVMIAERNLEVATNQFLLTKAGAWKFDIMNQEHQYDSYEKAAASSKALLEKFTLRAPRDGVILSVRTTIGSFISPSGTFETYTETLKPPVVMGGPQNVLQVRGYIDEILIHRLPPIEDMEARLFIRGTNIHIDLEFVRLQPYVIPKVQLSNQRTERVDTRVLPIIFKFARPENLHLYPGQIVDLYIGARTKQAQETKP